MTTTGVLVDLAAALDPVVLARQAGIDPDPWQVDVLRSNSRSMLLNCSRQSGKSTMAAVVAMHQVLYNPGATVLLLSPTLRQSQLLYQTCMTIYRSAGVHATTTSESLTRMDLSNGSRLVSLPGTEKTIRGYSAVDLLVVDEASRVDDALYHSVRPMLAVSGGRLIAMSTPYGTRGWWYEAWRGPEPWQRVEVPASMCPRISSDFLAEERRNMGEWWFSQEYLCQFLDAEDAVFRSADITNAIREDLESWTL